MYNYVHILGSFVQCPKCKSFSEFNTNPHNFSRHPNAEPFSFCSGCGMSEDELVTAAGGEVVVVEQATGKQTVRRWDD